MVKSNYNLYVTPVAYEDLQQIYLYITHELYNETAAKRIMDRIEEGFLMLKKFPHSCNFLEDEVLKDKGYRKLIIEDYVGIFTIDDCKKQVIIMRVLHGRQKYQDLI